MKPQALKNKADKFPSDLSKLTEEQKKKWFKVEEIPGGQILKLRTELFPPPVVQGDPVFFDKRSSYPLKKQESSIPTFSMEEDF